MLAARNQRAHLNQREHLGGDGGPPPAPSPLNRRSTAADPADSEGRLKTRMGGRPGLSPGRSVPSDRHAVAGRRSFLLFGRQKPAAVPDPLPQRRSPQVRIVGRHHMPLAPWSPQTNLPPGSHRFDDPVFVDRVAVLVPVGRGLDIPGALARVLAELGLAVNNPISRMNMNLHSGHLPGKNAHVTPFFSQNRESESTANSQFFQIGTAAAPLWRLTNQSPPPTRCRSRDCTGIRPLNSSRLPLQNV